MKSGRLKLTVWFAVVIGLLTPAMADSDEERIRRLERDMAELRELLTAARRQDEPTRDDRLDEIERRVELLAAELEEMRIGEAAVTADESVHGMGPAASKVYRTERGVSIGGYGEMFYASPASTREDGTPSGEDATFDFLRAVVYFGYKFNDRFLFNSEIEIEHASTSREGSVSVEFAYVDYLWRSQLNARGGLVLLPMGLLNELHEPTTFPSSSRPETERTIIPSTWRENGAGVFGELGPIDYRSYVLNGLDADGFTAGGLRGGRQKGSRAKSEDLAWVGRFDYAGTPGLLVGASAYFGDSGQDLTDASGRGIDVATSIVEAHLDWRWRGLEFRILGARAKLDDVARLNDALGFSGDESVGERMTGEYVQVGYDVFRWIKGSSRLVPFLRWERLNTQDRVPAGFMSNPANEREIRTAGFSFKPIEQVVIKLDYQDESNKAKTGVDQVNVALGYVF